MMNSERLHTGSGLRGSFFVAYPPRTPVRSSAHSRSSTPGRGSKPCRMGKSCHFGASCHFSHENAESPKMLFKPHPVRVEGRNMSKMSAWALPPLDDRSTEATSETGSHMDKHAIVFHPRSPGLSREEFVAICIASRNVQYFD